MKIMIVDDEVIIRTGLAKVIPWQDLGLRLLTPAASAEEVLDRLLIEKPDILLTDIRMTGKSGLQLAEEATALLPNLQIIILSGYDDFIYAQQAIRQNVSDYLLKTSKPEDIIKTVLRVKQRVEEKQNELLVDYQMRQEEHKRKLISWIVEGHDSKADHALLPSGEPPWQVLLLYAEGWGESDGERALLLFAVNNAIRDLLHSVSFIHGNKVVVLLGTGQSERDRIHRKQVFEHVQKVLKCKLIAVGGQLCEAWEQLSQSFATAKEAAAYRMFFTESSWEYADIAKRRGGKSVCTMKEEKELTAILLENDPIALKSWVCRYIQELLEDPQATPMSLDAALHSISLAAIRWLERAESSLGKKSSSSNGFKPFRIQDSEAQLEELFQHVFAIMKRYHNEIAVGRMSHVQKAIVYIEEQIGMDMGLHQVAEHVHVHPNHLSELFKKETGMKFVDFVAQTKMKKAMEILSSTPARISDVAANVGYEDVKYFGQMFKKHTGYTPSQYRERAMMKRGVR